MVGQILTMYCHEIDAHYYQGISNVQDGREVVPYEQRYCFQDATEEMVAENEQTGKDVVYIVRAPQVELFSADRYEICSFYDAFFVVTQK